MITAENYYGFVFSMVLSFGLAFELPVVILLLAAAGLVTPQLLNRYRRHAIVLIVTLSAFLTPGDFVSSTIAMAVPLYLLYELSVLVAYIIWRNRAALPGSLTATARAAPRPARDAAAIRTSCSLRPLTCTHLGRIDRVRFQRVVVLGLSLLLLACTDHARDSVRLDSASPSARAAVRTAAAPPELSWEDSTCMVNRTHAHPDAGALVREYAARNDSLGFFIGDSKANDDWLEGATECPGHQGGTDGVSLIVRYRVDSLIVRGDSAWFILTHAGVGAFDAVSGVQAQAFTRVDTQVVVRTPYGWRLSGQVGDPMLSVGAAARGPYLEDRGPGEAGFPDTRRQMIRFTRTTAEVRTMARVTGVGGVFFKSTGDRAALAAWYRALGTGGDGRERQ